MKNIITFLRKKTNWYAAFSLGFVGLSVGLPATSYAVTPQLYVKTSAQTLTTGSTVTAAIRINAGNVDGVDANLAFNPTYLQYISTDATNSAFPIELVSSASGSNVHIVRGLFAPDAVNSDALVATITFKAIAKVSSTRLGLSGNATYQGSYTNPAVGSTTVTIQNPLEDAAAPAVSIKKPLAESRSSDSFQVKAGATDNTGVVKMEVYADNVLMSTVRSNSINYYTYDVKSATVAMGAHTITVKAYDRNGNIGSSNATVYKQ